MNDNDVEKLFKFARLDEKDFSTKLIQIFQDYVQPYAKLSSKILHVAELQENLLSDKVKKLEANINRYIMALTILKENAKIICNEEKNINDLTIDKLQLKGIGTGNKSFNVPQELLNVYIFYFRNELYFDILSKEIIKPNLENQDSIKEKKLNYCFTTFAHNVSTFKLLFNEISSLLDNYCNLLNYLHLENNHFLMNSKQKEDISSISNDFEEKVKKEKEDLQNVEHKVTGHAMTLMGVLAAIITVIVTLTATSIQVMKSFDFYEQFLIILGIGVVIVVSMVFLLLISAFFFAAEDRRPTATKGLMLSAKIVGVILYFGFDFLCIFFFIEKIYTGVNNAHKNTLGFQVLIAAFMIMVAITTICFIWFVKRFSFKKIEIEKTSKKRKNAPFQKNKEILEQHNSEELEEQLEQNSIEQKVTQGSTSSFVQSSDKGEKDSSIEQNKNSNIDNLSKVQVHLANKNSIICYLISMIILLVLCYIFFVSYYAPSREISERHSQEIKILITEYKIEEIDDVPTNILFNYEGIQYIIAYDARLFHNGNLYFCEEHKTLE